MELFGYPSIDRVREGVREEAREFFEVYGRTRNNRGWPSWEHKDWLGFLANVRDSLRIPASLLADSEVATLLESEAETARTKLREQCPSIEALIAAIPNPEAVAKLLRVGGPSATQPLIGIIVGNNAVLGRSERVESSDMWRGSANDDVIRIISVYLRDSLASFGTEDLKAIASLGSVLSWKQVGNSVQDDGWVGYKVDQVDCSKVKQIASQELARRGA